MLVLKDRYMRGFLADDMSVAFPDNYSRGSIIHVSYRLSPKVDRRYFITLYYEYRWLCLLWQDPALVLVLVLVRVGRWTGSWLPSVVHIFAVVAVEGVLKAVDWCRVFHVGRKTIPSIDHSLTEEKIPCIQYWSVLCQFLLVSSEAMWRVCEVEELLVVNVLFPVNSLCTSIMSPLTLLSSSEVIHIICELQLFRSLKYNRIHPLRRPLPSERSTPYLTRSRVLGYRTFYKNSTILTSAILFRLWPHIVQTTKTVFSVYCFTVLFNRDTVKRVLVKRVPVKRVR